MLNNLTSVRPKTSPTINLCRPIIRPGCVSLYYQLSHGCQGDTEKYLTRGNLYHPRHTCITRDVVEGNTSVSRVIQVFEGQNISPYHPGNHVITTLSHRRDHKLVQNFMETGMKPNLRYVNAFVKM